MAVLEASTGGGATTTVYPGDKIKQGPPRQIDLGEFTPDVPETELHLNKGKTTGFPDGPPNPIRVVEERADRPTGATPGPSGQGPQRKKQPTGSGPNGASTTGATTTRATTTTTPAPTPTVVGGLTPVQFAGIAGLVLFYLVNKA